MAGCLFCFASAPHCRFLVCGDYTAIWGATRPLLGWAGRKKRTVKSRSQRFFANRKQCRNNLVGRATLRHCTKLLVCAGRRGFKVVLGCAWFEVRIVAAPTGLLNCGRRRPLPRWFLKNGGLSPPVFAPPLRGSQKLLLALGLTGPPETE